MYFRSLFAAALACAAILTSQAQTIQAPASSVDSSARAVVAITPVDASSFASKTEVNNAINLASAAKNRADDAYYNTGNYGQPWPKFFKGQYRYANNTNSYAYIDGNGYVSIWRYGYGWVSLGYSSGPQPLGWSTSYASFPYTNYESYTVYPTGWDYYGRPTDWAFSASLTSVQTW